MSATSNAIIAAVLLLGCIAAWWTLLRRRQNGEPLLPFESRRLVPWDASILGPVVLLFIFVRAAAMQGATHVVQGNDALRVAMDLSPDPQSWWSLPGYAALMFQAAAGSQVVTALATALLLVVYYRADRDDLGFSWRRLGGDVRLGVVGFFAAAVPAVFIQALMQTLVAKSQHPIVLAFGPGVETATIVWAAIAAVVVAPIAEEFLFRGVLQGWLERVWALRTPASLPDAESIAMEPVMDAAPSFAPIGISAAIFALMHIASGVDVVPLFFLALGLGYLYRQTHRLGPSIVVHMLLNAVSLTLLYFEAAA